MKVARPAEVNDPFELLALNCMARELRSELKRFKNAQHHQIGLLCFSEAWKNPVLWSHYADGHKGICLGFDLKATLGLRGLQRVKYEQEKLQVKLRDRQDQGPIPRDVKELLLLTKFKHWDYEQELRAIIDLTKTTHEGDLYFYPFGDEIRLREVVLGPLCPASSLMSIRALARESAPDVLVSRARLGFKYFEVKPDGRYRPK